MLKHVILVASFPSTKVCFNFVAKYYHPAGGVPHPCGQPPIPVENPVFLTAADGPSSATPDGMAVHQHKSS
jgi:hypothetical protein